MGSIKYRAIIMLNFLTIIRTMKVIKRLRDWVDNFPVNFHWLWFSSFCRHLVLLRTTINEYELKRWKNLYPFESNRKAIVNTNRFQQNKHKLALHSAYECLKTLFFVKNNSSFNIPIQDLLKSIDLHSEFRNKIKPIASNVVCVNN